MQVTPVLDMLSLISYGQRASATSNSTTLMKSMMSMPLFSSKGNRGAAAAATRHVLQARQSGALDLRHQMSATLRAEPAA